MKGLLAMADEVAELVDSFGMKDDESKAEDDLRGACKRHIDSLVRKDVGRLQNSGFCRLLGDATSSLRITSRAAFGRPPSSPRADRSRFSCSRRFRSSSFTVMPRPTLTRNAEGFISAKRAASIIPSVCGVWGGGHDDEVGPGQEPVERLRGMHLGHAGRRVLPVGIDACHPHAERTPVGNKA